MLCLVIVPLVTALVAAWLGYGEAVRYSWDGVKVVGSGIVILAALSATAGAFRRRSPEEEWEQLGCGGRSLASAGVRRPGR
jgi:hypothetical protein